MRNSANGELNEADILVHPAHACLPNTKVLNRTQSETRSQRNDERGSMIICSFLRWRIRQVNLLMSSAVVDGRAPARNHRDRWTVARSPWQNAYVERLSGICADLIFSNDTSLEDFPTRYAMCRALSCEAKPPPSHAFPQHQSVGEGDSTEDCFSFQLLNVPRMRSTIAPQRSGAYSRSAKNSCRW